MKPNKVIPFDEHNLEYSYRCPYYRRWGFREIPDEKTATALFIYFHIYFRPPKGGYNFRKHIWCMRKFKIISNDTFSRLILFLCEQDYKYFKGDKDDFYGELKYLVSSSPLWDWVIPHLRKTYPDYNFMEVKNETI